MNATASDIFNEVNNTLKSRLVIATGITVTDILNASFPTLLRASTGITSSSVVGSKATEVSGTNNAGMPDLSHVVSVSQDTSSDTLSDPLFWNWHNRRLYSPPSLTFAVEYAAIDALGGDQGAFDMVHNELNKWLASQDHRVRDVSHDTGHGSHDRRLVFYTDDIPATIDSINDAPLILCPGATNSGMFHCTIISSTVCVVLGPDDDEKTVRTVLIQGLGQAIDSGEFEANIPPEDGELA